MARYIDADNLIAHLKDEIKGCEPPFGSRTNGKSIAYGTKLGLKSAISFAETLSTEDVIPRSELAVRTFKDAATIHRLQEDLKEANIKIVMYEGIVDKILPELKKKHTEIATPKEEWCVLCGETIPEGRQVCPICNQEVGDNDGS